MPTTSLDINIKPIGVSFLLLLQTIHLQNIKTYETCHQVEGLLSFLYTGSCNLPPILADILRILQVFLNPLLLVKRKDFRWKVQI